MVLFDAGSYRTRDPLTLPESIPQLDPTYPRIVLHPNTTRPDSSHTFTQGVTQPVSPSSPVSHDPIEVKKIPEFSNFVPISTVSISLSLLVATNFLPL